jgi:uncharacterized membrane protein YidH (DUF202 family)
MKWIGVAVLAVIGIIAAFVAIEYLVVPIHSLPTFLPGHKNVNGHYHKRGAIAAVVAIIAFVAAILLAVRITRQGAGPTARPATAPVGPTPSSADELLSAPAPTPTPPIDNGDAQRP